MKKTIILSLVSAALAAVLAIFIYKTTMESETETVSYIEYVSTKNSLSIMMYNAARQYQLCGQELKGNIDVLRQLQEKCENRQLVVFRFGDASCDVCVKAAMFELLDIEKSIIKDNFLIVTNYSDEKNYRDFIRKFNSKNSFNTMNIEYSPYLYIENRDEALPPHFFVLENGNLIPQKLFFYIKECPEMNRKYFELVFGRKQ